MGNFNDLSLAESLKQLPKPALELLKAHRFDPAWLVDQARQSAEGSRSNLISGKLTAPRPEDIISPEELSEAERTHFRKLGEDALQQGHCALVVLAGGMATRMGGVIKALVPAIGDKSFLDLRLQEQASLAQRYGKVPPLWLMTSHATHQGTAEALGDRVDQKNLGLFRQGLSVRLSEDYDVFLDEAGEPSLHAPGHGDLPSSLQASGLLDDFVQQGGRYVLVTNIDNLGGGLDPVLIGMHLHSACPVTCEVVDKLGSDKGGIPINCDEKLVVLEEFRIPSSFDPSTVPVFNVNSFAFDAQALCDLEMDWTYFEVKKSVGEKKAIQYERLINEVTFALPTQYLRVPRTGPESRFLPVKDFDELAARKSELAELGAHRGMI